MQKLLFPVLAGIIGILVGYMSSITFFAHSWTALFLWGATGLLIGYFVPNKITSHLAGALFGVTLVASFLLFGFHGASDKFLGFLVLTTVLSIVGALCGLVVTYIGFWAKYRTTLPTPVQP